MINRISSEKINDINILRNLRNSGNLGKKDSCSCSDSSYKFQRYISSMNSGSTAHVYSQSSGNTEFEGIESKEDQIEEEKPIDDPYKIPNQKHLLNCLSYWRENLYPDNYKFKKYF